MELATAPQQIRLLACLQAGLKATAVACEEDDVLGVNSRIQLAEAEAVFQKQRRNALMESGVTMIDPETVYVSADTEIGSDVTLEPNVFIGPKVKIGDGVTIRAFSHLEGCTIGPKSQIGPFARLRPGAFLSEGVHIGNFVEVKNVEIGPGSKANHLSYLGDGMIGSG